MSTIYQMVKTGRFTQRFGQSSACRHISTHKIIGKRGETCPAGYEDFYKAIGMKGHNGDDISCWHGEPIYFNVDMDTEWYAKEASDLDGGLGVDVFSKSRVLIPELPKQAGSEARREWSKHNKKLYVKFRYWHLLEGYKDKDVKLGEKIGLGDNTGASSGDHIHFSCKIVDEHGRTLDKWNGYYGAVNMREIFKSDNRFILDVLKKKREMNIQQRITELQYRIANLIRRAILLLRINILEKKLSTSK